MRRLTPIVLLILLLLIAAPAVVYAQPPGKPTGSTPTPAAEGPPIALPTQPAVLSPSTLAPRLDLAAMTLDSTVVPEGYTLFYELYLPGSRIGSDLTGGLITQAEIDATGLQWYYESVYISADGNTRLRSYVEQYTDADGAVRGFSLLEDENRLAPAGAVFHDGPGAGVGEEPSEISEGSLQPAGTPMTITSIDSTFRTGNLLAGVSVDTIPGIAADRQLVIDLSQVLFDRIQTVLTNQPVALIDYTLPGRIVTLGTAWSAHDEGYLGPTEVFGPRVDPAIAGAFVSGYFTNESPPTTSSAPFPVPLVSLTVASFQNESALLQLLSGTNQLAPPFDGVQPLDIAPIPGSSVTQAYQYINPVLSTDTAKPDSVRIVMVAGSNLLILDIQANKTLDGARDAAIRIATAQAACLTVTTPCAPLQLPDDLLESPIPPAVPTPSPVG